MNPINESLPIQLTSKMLEFKGIWEDAINQANFTGKKLGQFLTQVKNSHDVILVGHSLGGRVVMKALEEFSGNNKFIGGAITLAAAISDEDLILYNSILNACQDNISILHSSNDKPLKAYKVVMKSKEGPMGLLGSQKLSGFSKNVSKQVFGHGHYKEILPELLTKINFP